MTLARVRELNPRWTVEPVTGGLQCTRGDGERVLAADPDDAEISIAGIEGRDPSPEAARRPAAPTAAAHGSGGIW